MNIKEAKEEIKNAMLAYFTKDEFGEYEIPLEHQRPIFLMGPPGIGKTEIMRQVASELGVGLVSYSMTHHTRQSALGLPFIVHKNYDGLECDISEYTMSEIIASVYDMMEKTGLKEGILFLDEINCVSETLAPAMLQFLQYKIFGRHSVPEGWIVVTAGNPPEFNNSVREFDIVTWDRLKRMDVEPDFEVWKEYAYSKGIHASVITYLEIKKSNFYKIETTVDGKSFVTARGWSDLSDMIKLYEKRGLKVTERLAAQYIQNGKIAKDFAIYYDLFNKYKSDYQVEAILEGRADDSVKAKAQCARFDERLALIGLLLDGVTEKLKAVCLNELTTKELLTTLKGVKLSLAYPDADVAETLEKQIKSHKSALESGRKASSLSLDSQFAHNSVIQILGELQAACQERTFESNEAVFAFLKADFDERNRALKQFAESAGQALSHVFAFCEEVFRDGQEMLILVTELTVSYYCAHFISRYGCDEYYAHNKELLFYERQKEIISDYETLDLDLL